MKRSQRGPDERCGCGRLQRAARVVRYRSFSASYRYHRCECGTEWTERFPHVDRTVPISGDELLDVHLLLESLDGGLNDLVDTQA